MKKAVLVMAYGSPNKLEDIEPFYTDIRRGNKPSPELLHELTERYKAIGGSSPLLVVTVAQANGIAHELGDEYTAYVGMRHWTPWIPEALEQMRQDGIEKAVGVVMAPHFSGMSVARYIALVEDAKQKMGYSLEIEYIQSWYDHPLFIEALNEKIESTLQHFTEEEKAGLKVIFTAHSLPEKILENNDPYKDQLLETSRLVAEKAGINNWTFAFQSAGRTQEKWLGPDLLEVLHAEAEAGLKAVLICSVGFITDHLEVLYDIDIEGKAKAKELGMHLERTPSLNADPRLARLIADLVKEKING